MYTSGTQMGDFANIDFTSVQKSDVKRYEYEMATGIKCVPEQKLVL